MTARTASRVLARLGVVSLASAALVAGGVAAGATAVPAQVDITVGDIAASRPAAGGWFVDNQGSGGSTGGAFSITQDGPGNDAAMKLSVSTTSDAVYIFNGFALGSGPRDIPALLTGASYDYAGLNVNFQLQLVFTPSDPAYGPGGSTQCASAVAWGLSADPAACYTALKWEPYVRPGTAAWTHVDLSVDSAAQSSTSTGGWVSSKRLGQYPGNVSNGQLMSTYLDEIADYEVTAFVFGIGTGTPGPDSAYLKSYTIGGTSYGFAPTATPPATPPAADSDALLQLIDDAGVDVAADTAKFDAGTDLTKLDVSSPIDAVFAGWSDPSDAFVDVYAYSTASYLGTFPVVGGDVMLTGLDLSALAPGGHHLLLRGQSSDALAVVAFSVLAAAAPDPALAATGVEAGLVSGAALLLLVVGGVLLGVARRMRRSITA
jgi:hypothetical protein